MSNVLSTAYAYAAELRRIGLDLGRRWSGRSFGPLVGIRKGVGSENDESRPYVPGDDLRRLDRRHFRRTGGEINVFNTIAEHELDVWFIVKQTPGMAFGSRFVSKREMTRGLIAATGHMTSGYVARYGLILAGPSPEPVIQVELSRTRDILRVIDSQVATTGLSANGSVGDALRFAAERADRRSMFVGLSDLLDHSWQEPIKQLAYEHRVMVVEVIDPAEITLPFAGLRRLVNPDTGSDKWTWITPTKRAAFQEAAIDQRIKHAEHLANAGALHVQVFGHQGWMLDLLNQVNQFKQERRWSA